jgi:hypothetical protein
MARLLVEPGIHCLRQGTNLTALFAHITGGCDAAYNPYQGSEVSPWTLLVYCRVKTSFCKARYCVELFLCPY